MVHGELGEIQTLQLDDIDIASSFALYRNERMVTSWNEPNIKIKLSRISDWRHLERRSAQLCVKYRERLNLFWSTLKDMYVLARKNGAHEVWLCEEDGQRVWTYCEYGLGNDQHDVLMKRMVDRPRSYAFIPDKAVTAEMLARYKASNVWRRRWYAYDSAFKVAVGRRLQKYLYDEQQKRPYERFRRYEPRQFIITNEGRRYVVLSSEQGTLTWVDDGLTVCT